MKSTLFRLVGMVCFFLLLTPSDSASVQERRTALVIGNGAYKSSPLANSVNDANDMAAALKKLGFSVKLSINSDQKSMEDAIRSFGKELRSGGVGLFYFAGHGIQVHGRNYLIPVDADIESEADVKYESVDAGRVLSQMYEAENGLNIMILDACRDNPYARSFRTSEKGLAKMDAPTGSILAYATAPESVAADGSGRNGLYTSMLLKHMMEPNLIIERVFKKVRVDVMKESANRQVPWESSSLTGDFYFSSKRGIVVKNPPEVESEKSIKQTPKYTSISPEVLQPQEIARDRRFIAYDNGTVKDTKTGLMWASKDNGEDIDWKDTKRYCENYRGGGYTDWRMPTREELEGLYDRSESYQAKQRSYNVHLTK
ncbi:MAG: caspase family protein, partial [Proteobacteria bacterium]|nr:caspase family protein [Pseudomonadota bacterium]